MTAGRGRRSDPWSAPRLVLCGVGTLVVLAGLGLAVPEPATRRTIATETQTLLGGLGGGRPLHMTRCRVGFDPRLGMSCDFLTGASPSASVLCTDHGSRGGGLTRE